MGADKRSIQNPYYILLAALKRRCKRSDSGEIVFLKYVVMANFFAILSLISYDL